MRRWRFAWSWTIGVVLITGLLGCGGIDLPCPPFCPPPQGEPYDCDAPPEAEGRFYVPAGWKSGRVIIVLRRSPGPAGLLPAATVYNRLVAEFEALKEPRRLPNVGMIGAGADVELIRELLLDKAIRGVYAVRTYQVTPIEGQDVASWGLDAIDARSGLDGRYEPRATGKGVRGIVNDTGVDRERSGGPASRSRAHAHGIRRPAPR